MTITEIDPELVARLAGRLAPAEQLGGRVLGACEHAGCKELHGPGFRLCPFHQVEHRRESRRRYYTSRRRVA